MGVSTSSFEPVFDEVYYYCSQRDVNRSVSYHETYLHSVIDKFTTQLQDFAQSRKASAADDVKRVGQLLNRVHPGTGFSPLGIACQRNNANAVEVLLKCAVPVDPDVIQKDGRTPLLVATQRKLDVGGPGDDEKRRCSHQILRLLLEARASVNAVDSAGNSALLAAFRHSNYKASKLLLQSGADVCWQNHAGQSPLLLCVVSCDDAKKGKKRDKFEKLLLQLLEAKANTDAADKQGMTPLVLATSCGLAPVVDLLLGPRGRANPDLPNSRGVVPVVAAVIRSRVLTLQRLCAGKADVNAPVPGGATALGIAVGRRHTSSRSADKQLKIASILLQAKADANAANAEDNGSTPLLLAAAAGATACARLLVQEAKADINVKGGPGGRTALIHAVVSSDAAMVEEILLLGGCSSRSLAIAAKRNGDALTGPEPSSETQGGSRSSATRAALQDRAEHLATQCEAASAKMESIGSAIKAAAAEERFDELSKLAAQRAIFTKELEQKKLEAGKIRQELADLSPSAAAADAVAASASRVIDLDTLCDNGRTALMYAAGTAEQVPVLRLLLAAGANPAVRGAHGFTALGVAVFSNNPEGIELLVQSARADVTQTMPGGSQHNLVQMLCVSPAAFAPAKQHNDNLHEQREQQQARGWTSQDVEMMEADNRLDDVSAQTGETGAAGEAVTSAPGEESLTRDESSSSNSHRRMGEHEVTRDPIVRFERSLTALLAGGVGPVQFNAQEPTTGRNAVMLACSTSRVALVERLLRVVDRWWTDHNNAQVVGAAPPPNAESSPPRDAQFPLDVAATCADGKAALHYLLEYCADHKDTDAFRYCEERLQLPQ